MPAKPTSGHTTPSAPVMLRGYERYEKAEAAVERLSREGFPVGRLTIVWSRLRRVEHVTGRRTVASAGRDGAISGLWFGTVIGLLMLVFVQLDEDTTAVGLLAAYALVGAAAGAGFSALVQTSRRGRRDFGSHDLLDAESFELWVDREYRDHALRILETTTAGTEVKMTEPDTSSR